METLLVEIKRLTLLRELEFMRERGSTLPSLRASPVLEDGNPLVPVAEQVREAEIGLSPLGQRVRPGDLAYRQADPDLSPRMPTQAAVPAQVTAWAETRNAAPKGIHWQFRTADARVRLKHLYPTIET